MTAQIIDGDKIAADLKTIVRDEVAALGDGASCCLATVLVGDDIGSVVYAARIARVAAELGIEHRPVRFPGSVGQAGLVERIRSLNDDRSVHGILLLRPLPGDIDEAAVFQALDPAKDVEGITPVNTGLLTLGTPRFRPSTAAAAFHILDSWLDDNTTDRADFYRQSLIVVVGRSNNVGKPAISLAFERQAAVESVDEWASKAGQLGWHTRRADVLIVAAGVPGLIQAEHVKEGAIVLDVGINPVVDPASGQTSMVGDVEAHGVAGRARAMTPVPGGVGPVTDVWLVRNTAMAARIQASGR